MSHKGSRSRVQDRKAWDECPLWDKKNNKKEQKTTPEEKPNTTKKGKL